ncbi:MAG: recombinase family protein [Deltaproteobacteria bacterium]|nr:recombinase family protein [Deltaproteobacteria bacterium]
MFPHILKQAVVYCRVSSQESTCRSVAADQGFTVTRVFTDDFTGGGDFWQRPGIRALLEYLDEQDDEIAVIFDDIKRSARDAVFHLKLRKELSVRSAFPL